MISLTINNSECSIEGLEPVDLTALRALLSYRDPMSNVYAPGRNTTVYLLTKRGAFPTGLLYLVEEYLKKNKLNHTRSDKRVKPKAIPGLFVWQK